MRLKSVGIGLLALGLVFGSGASSLALPGRGAVAGGPAKAAEPAPDHGPAEARRDAERAKTEMIASARAEIQTERERLHREIQVETDQALQSLWTRAAELATQVSAAALGRQIDSDGHRRLIDEALAELKTAAKRGA